MEYASAGPDGKVNSVTFKYYDGTLKPMSSAHVRGGKVSLAGIGTWGVTDSVLTYWREGDAYRMFDARVIEIDNTNCVANVMFSNSDESWLPFGFIHKLEIPADSEFESGLAKATNKN